MANGKLYNLIYLITVSMAVCIPGPVVFPGHVYGYQFFSTVVT
jgi:hypothetical protein